MTTSEPGTKLVREGRYLAEVDVVFLEDDHPWSPLLSREDALKLDKVRLALRRGDIGAAAKSARIFELVPVDTNTSLSRKPVAAE